MGPKKTSGDSGEHHTTATAGSDALAGRARLALFDGQRDKQRRSLPDGARYFDRPAERVDTVSEADESGTARRIGPSGAIIADRELENTVTRLHGDVDRGSMRMLRGIRERF